jgi:hypothetical protein
VFFIGGAGRMYPHCPDFTSPPCILVSVSTGNDIRHPVIEQAV